MEMDYERYKKMYYHHRIQAYYAGLRNDNELKEYENLQAENYKTLLELIRGGYI